MKIYSVIEQLGYDGEVEKVKTFFTPESANRYNELYYGGKAVMFESDLDEEFKQPDNDLLPYVVTVTLADKPCNTNNLHNYGYLWAHKVSYTKFLQNKPNYHLGIGSLDLYFMADSAESAKQLAIEKCQKLIDAGKMPYATDKIEREKFINSGREKYSLSGCGNPFLRNYPENIHLDEEFIKIVTE